MKKFEILLIVNYVRGYSSGYTCMCVWIWNKYDENACVYFSSRSLCAAKTVCSVHPNVYVAMWVPKVQVKLRSMLPMFMCTTYCTSSFAFAFRWLQLNLLELERMLRQNVNRCKRKKGKATHSANACSCTSVQTVYFVFPVNYCIVFVH